MQLALAVELDISTAVVRKQIEGITLPDGQHAHHMALNSVIAACRLSAPCC
jgi:hypothetical protein